MAAELKIRRGSVAVELWVEGAKQFEIDLPGLKFEELENIRIVIDDHKPPITIERAGAEGETETVQALWWDEETRGYGASGGEARTGA